MTRPALFIGHGSPMNALEENRFSLKWGEISRSFPRPRAILTISAHWETTGTRVTSTQKPRTIHDFGGFPRELHEYSYPAPGSPELAGEIRELFPRGSINPDSDRGLDHGTWSILCHMYPEADVPVVQLSLDRNKTPGEHFALAAGLSPLRNEDILILGSGNMVHNLPEVRLHGNDFNSPNGYDWALEADELFCRLLTEKRYGELVSFRDLGPAAVKSIPTAEHFLPLLYIAALRGEDETLTFFNREAIGGSLTMTSFLIGE